MNCVQQFAKLAHKNARNMKMSIARNVQSNVTGVPKNVERYNFTIALYTTLANKLAQEKH